MFRGLLVHPSQSCLPAGQISVYHPAASTVQVSIERQAFLFPVLDLACGHFDFMQHFVASPRQVRCNLLHHFRWLRESPPLDIFRQDVHCCYQAIRRWPLRSSHLVALSISHASFVVCKSE